MTQKIQKERSKPREKDVASLMRQREYKHATLQYVPRPHRAHKHNIMCGRAHTEVWRVCILADTSHRLGPIHTERISATLHLHDAV